VNEVSALRKCPACAAVISMRAPSCPQCGEPMEAVQIQIQPQAQTQKPPEGEFMMAKTHEVSLESVLVTVFFFLVWAIVLFVCLVLDWFLPGKMILPGIISTVVYAAILAGLWRYDTKYRCTNCTSYIVFPKIATSCPACKAKFVPVKKTRTAVPETETP
jgi:Zn finger protein HypA/HybF involved in hydrogenase expression